MTPHSPPKPLASVNASFPNAVRFKSSVRLLRLAPRRTRSRKRYQGEVLTLEVVVVVVVVVVVRVWPPRPVKDGGGVVISALSLTAAAP